jgi:hypothetical protein
MSNVLEQLRGEDGSVDARRLNTGAPSPHAEISARECYRLRVAVAHGVMLKEHTRAARYGSSAAYDHATGRCDHDVSVPPLAFKRTDFETFGEWVVRDE